MKVVAISYFMPYWENLRGISALIFYLIKYRPYNVDLMLYSFNCNHLSDEQIEEVKKELDISIKLIEEPKEHKKYKAGLYDKFVGWMIARERNMFILSEETIAEIRHIFPDYIWLYPFYLYHIPEQMPEMKYVLTGCDSNALLKKRCLKDRYYRSNPFKYIKNMIIFYRNLKTEERFPTKNCLIHFVGKADCDYYNSHTGHNNGCYITHPHYAYSVNKKTFDNNKLNLLIAGKYDFYMKTESNRLVSEMVKYAKLLEDKVTITFIGKKWDKHARALSKAGYTVVYKQWVENYIEEILKYDVQIVPLSFGTGTKGKVLDAMSNGLLVIGTKYAMENICTDKDKCLVYDKAHDVINMINTIYENRNYYKQMAINGKNHVLAQNNPATCSSSFFNLFESI